MQPAFPRSSQLDGAQQIGVGGSGVVYSADHQKWGKVAVKVAVNSDPQICRLLQSEYTLLRSLRHSSILEAFDYFHTSDGRPALVTRLCDGGDFYSYADKLNPAERVRALVPVLSALEYLHSLGLIHRDLKGENILLHSQLGPILSDLGLAASKSSDNKERGGTLEYMAPEVIDNLGATVESDIYSLGVMLYRLATSSLPFDASDPMQVISNKRKPDVLPWATVENAISPRFAKFVRQCMDPDPTARPKSVREIADQLRLDGLVAANSYKGITIGDLLHHHLYSYNYSYASQLLRQLNSDATVMHHYQNDAVGLSSVVADFLKLSGYTVEWKSDHQLASKNDSESFKVNFESESKQHQHGVIDYPEFDSFALRAILGKIFTKELDVATADWLDRMSSGNMALAKILLHQAEEANQIDLKSGRWRMTPIQIAEFEPCKEYYQLAGELTPAIPPALGELARFIAVGGDHFPMSELVHLERATREQLDDLVNWGLLDTHFAFVRSYFRPALRSKQSQEQLLQNHQDWIKIILETDDLAPQSRESLLFEHHRRAGSTQEAAAAALRLADLLIQHQKLEEGATIVELALRLPDIHRQSNLYIGLLTERAQLANALGDHNRALSDHARIVRYARRIDDHDSVATAYKRLGDVYKAKRDYRRGNRALANAIKHYTECHNEIELSHCYNNLGNMHWINGDLDQAAESYLNALTIQRRLGEMRGVASTLSNLGSLYVVRQDYETGIRLFKESIEIKKQLSDLPELARTYNNLSITYTWLDELNLSLEYLQQAFEINKRIGADSELLYNYENFYEVELHRGNFARAREWLIEGLKASPRDNHPARGGFITFLARLFLIEGRYDKTGALLSAAGDREQRVTDRTLSMNLAATFAEYYSSLFDFGAAHDHIETAAEHAQKMGELRSLAYYLLVKARIERALGVDPAKIAEILEESEKILDKISAKRIRLEHLIERAELALYSRDADKAVEMLSLATSFPDFDGISVFRPRLYLLRGRFEAERGEYNRATMLLNDSVLAAKGLSLPEYTWKGLLTLGDCHARENHLEKSLKSYIEAFNIVKELARRVPDPRLRKLYLGDKQKRILAKRLEEMSSLVA